MIASIDDSGSDDKEDVQKRAGGESVDVGNSEDSLTICARNVC